MLAIKADPTSFSVWFAFTLQPRRDPGRKQVGVIQLAGEPLLVTVQDVPRSEVVDGRLSQAVLWRAEETFLECVEERHPAHDVIAWEARVGGADGPPLSSFRNLLPSHQD